MSGNQTISKSIQQDSKKQDDEGGGGGAKSHDSSIFIVIIGFTVGIIIMLTIIWWVNKIIILKKRQNQLLVHKIRGNLLLQGVTHFISLNKVEDYTLYFPEIAMDLSQESIRRESLNQSRKSSLSWMKQGPKRFKNEQAHQSQGDFELQNFVDILSKKNRAGESIKQNEPFADSQPLKQRADIKILPNNLTYSNLDKRIINNLQTDNQLFSESIPMSQLQRIPSTKTYQEPIIQNQIDEENFNSININEHIENSEFLDREISQIIEHQNNTNLFGFANDENQQITTIREIQSKRSSQEISLDEIIIANKMLKPD